MSAHTLMTIVADLHKERAQLEHELSRLMEENRQLRAVAPELTEALKMMLTYATKADSKAVQRARAALATAGVR